MKKSPAETSPAEISPAETKADGDIEAMTDAAVLAQFESLGDNCEFGLVQRACGADPAGLLAFARTPPDVLADVLRSDLDEVSDPRHMRLAARSTGTGTEYVLINDRHGIVYHIVADAVPEDTEDLLLDEARRLHRLEAALRVKLARAEHIFVVKCNDDLTDDEAGDVHEQLARYGRNALLYVVQADPAHPEGSVVRIAENLYRGHIGRFAPYCDAYDSSIPTWTAICRNALRLHRAAASAELALA